MPDRIDGLFDQKYSRRDPPSPHRQIPHSFFEALLMFFPMRLRNSFITRLAEAHQAEGRLVPLVLPDPLFLPKMKDSFYSDLVTDGTPQPAWLCPSPDTVLRRLFRENGGRWIPRVFSPDSFVHESLVLEEAFDLFLERHSNPFCSGGV